MATFPDQIEQAYRGKRVLITGGLGFIGSHLARSLTGCGANVTVIDNLNAEYGGNWKNIEDIKSSIAVVEADIRDANLIRELVIGQEFIFNLAAQTSHVGSMNEPFVDLEINTQAQLVLMEACRLANPDVRVVFASTRQIYGKPDYLPVDESHPIRPVDVNGIHKLAAEWYHQLYLKVYGMRPTILRLTNTYGPGMRVKDAKQTFVGIWLKMILEGVPLKVFGDGLQARDFVYIDDCVSAFLLAGASDCAIGKTYNVCGTEPIKLLALAKLLASLDFGGSYSVEPFPAERSSIDIGSFYGDSALIESDLGWRPRIGLEEGLSRSLEYYARNREFYF